MFLRDLFNSFPFLLLRLGLIRFYLYMYPWQQFIQTESRSKLTPPPKYTPIKNSGHDLSSGHYTHHKGQCWFSVTANQFYNSVVSKLVNRVPRMTGVLDSLASQIGASVEATSFLLSLFIGKANSCVFKIDVSRKLRYGVLRCSCVFLKY